MATNQVIQLIKPLRLLLMSVCALITSEWLFFVTKPSFLHQQTFFGKVIVLFFALAICILIISLVFLSVRFVLSPFGRFGEKATWYVSCLASSTMVLFLVMLMIDNFTYTVWGEGIRTIEFTSYARLIFGCYAVFWMWVLRLFLKKPQSVADVPISLGLSAFFMTICLLFLNGLIKIPGSSTTNLSGAQDNLPNIVIFGADGLEASHMSVYGYERNTTPFLLEKQTEFMISDSSYSNSDRSAGSVSSMLTGKLPTTTGLYSELDKLRGRDQFQHLPAILNSNGYSSLNMTIRRWVDPEDQNFKCGFEQSNYRDLNTCIGMPDWYRSVLGFFSMPLVLLNAIQDRIEERLSILNPWDHRPMYDLKWLRWGERPDYWTNDDSRMEVILRYLKKPKSQPFFIHTHFLSSHGPNYYPSKPTFSKSDQQKLPWQDNFYDDAIINIDNHIAKIYNMLDEIGELDSTIIVITSDHGRNFQTLTRMPMLVRFPKSQHKGRFPGLTQRLDIAPTVLDFSGIKIPDWMEGRSLVSINTDKDAANLIFQSDTIDVNAQVYTGKNGVRLGPELNALGALNVVQCNMYVNWNLKSNIWTNQVLPDVTSVCENETIYKPGDLLLKAADHLIQRGHDEVLIHDLLKTAQWKELSPIEGLPEFAD